MRVRIFLFLLLFSCKQPDEEVTPVGVSVSLFAEEQFYSVNYFLNGATEGNYPIDNNRYKSGDIIVIKNGNGIYKYGSSIKSWNNAPDGSGIHFDFYQKVELSNADLNLYAFW